MKNYHALLVICLALIYIQLLNGGLHVANDLPISSGEIVSSFFSLPNAYSSIQSPFGLNQISTLWSWPYNFLYGFLQTLGITRNLQIIFLGLIPICFFASIGIWKLSNFLKLSNSGRIISILVYLSNTYIILLIDGGQLLWALAYSFLPLCLYWVEKLLNEKKKDFLTPAVGLTGLGFFDLRAVIVLFAILLLRFVFGLFNKSRKELINWFTVWIKLGAIYLLLFLVLNFYWLLPVLMVQKSVVPSNLSVSVNSDFLGFTTLIHGLFLFQPHWYKNIFGQTSLPHPFFVIFPIIALTAPLFRKKDLHTGFLLLLGLCGIFLVKGILPPGGSVYEWMFNNIPGFFIFRDPTKFFIFIALSYAGLIGITVTEIEKRVQKKYSYIGYLMIFLITGSFLIMSAPAISGKTTGLLSANSLEIDYTELENNLRQDPRFSKVLWVPQKPPAGFMNFIHPSVNATDLSALRPFAGGIKGTYETINFLREASYSGQLLDISGVGYLAYSPLDPNREFKPDQLDYHKTFLDQLKRRIWVSSSKVNSKIPLLKTGSNQELFFTAANSYFVVGSDTIYGESTKSGDLRLSNNALIFAEEYPGIVAGFEKIPDAKIILNKTSITDLAALFIPKAELIFPAANLEKHPGTSGWWKRDTSDFAQWKDFLFQKYGIQNQDFDLNGGWAVGEGELQLDLPINSRNKEQIILIRVLESSRSGKLKVSSNSEIVGEINTQDAKDSFRWFEAGKLKPGSQYIQISSTGRINVINALAIIDQSVWSSFITMAGNLKQSGKIVQFAESKKDNSGSSIKYKKINESKYEISISGLSNPGMLVFSQAYDPFWQLDGGEPIRVYSFLNGFPIDKNGTFILEYKPQRYVELGSLVSLSSLLLLSIIFIRFKTKKT